MGTEIKGAVEYLAARWAGMLFIGCHPEADVLAEAAEFARLGGGGDVAARAVARAMRDCRRKDTETCGSYIVDRRRGWRLEGVLSPRLRRILEAAAQTVRQIQGRDQWHAAHVGRIVDLYDPSVSRPIGTYDDEFGAQS